MGGGRVVEWAGPAVVTPIFAAHTILECGKGIGHENGKIETCDL